MQQSCEGEDIKLTCGTSTNKLNEKHSDSFLILNKQDTWQKFNLFRKKKKGTSYHLKLS